MRTTNRKKHNDKRSIGKVFTGVLLGSVVGATVGLLMAPASGQEIRRRITGEVKGVREKTRTAAGNIESKARELAAEVNENAGEAKKTVTRRKKVASTKKQGIR